jgi:hypothetical protein
MGILLVVIFLFGIYLLPCIVGWNKKKFPMIMLINVFLGWTIIGWVIALFIAIEDLSWDITHPNNMKDLHRVMSESTAMCKKVDEWHRQDIIKLTEEVKALNKDLDRQIEDARASRHDYQI